MDKVTKTALRADLKRLLRKNPGTASMEVLIPDVLGTLRGKRVRRSSFEKLCSEPFSFCGGTVWMSALGGVLPGMPGDGDGDPDTPAILVPGSLAPVPWSSKPSAQALFRLLDQNGNPYPNDPRAVLERALAPLRKMRLQPVMATELEFYLLDARAASPTPRAPRIPGIGRPQPGPQVYHPDDLAEIEPFLDDVYAFCDSQRIPADTAISEFAPAQFEINLKHVDDPVLACDHAVLLKRVIKAAARRHGFVACFMAKPFAEDSGNGLHIHMSLLDRHGKNYFSRGRDKLSTPPFSASLRYAVGGLLRTMPEATALFAPNANSYRRLLPENFAPVEPNWGVNHRVVAVRVPQSGAADLRFEHRVAGADANPYLVTAAIAAGVHYGIRNKIDPGRMITEGQKITPKMKIPDRWDTALDRFARSRVLPDYLGEEFCQLFLSHRRSESREFHNTVPLLDFEYYLRSA